MRSTRVPLTLMIATLAALLPSLPARAQSVEITPFVGTRLGGEFEIREFDEFGSFDVGFDIDDGESFGLLLDFAITRNLQFELGFSRQETELKLDEGFLGPELFLTEVDLDYWHAGVLYQWTPGQVKPFVALSIGATIIDPVDFEFPDETRLSVGVGAGVKLMLQRNLGVRLEGRFIGTPIEEKDELVCDRFGVCFEDPTIDDQLEQLELRGGVIFAF